MKSEDLHIAEPCHENWDAMEDRGARRFCDSCVKEVHDLSMLTAQEAQDLLGDREDVCIRYLSDDDGQVLFRDESSSTWRLHRQKEGAKTLMAAASMAFMVAACEPTPEPAPEIAPNAITIEPGSPARLNVGAGRAPQATRIEVPGWLLAYLSTSSDKAHTKITAYLSAPHHGVAYNGVSPVDVHVKLNADDVAWLRDYLSGLPAQRRPALLLDETTMIVPVMHDPAYHLTMGQAIAPMNTNDIGSVRPPTTHPPVVRPKPVVRPTPVIKPVVKPRPTIKPRMGRRIRRDLHEIKGKIQMNQKHLQGWDQ